MKLAIMQPYLFPYLGYFQLIKTVDTFVVYDDVNFIKGGWINRNFILSQGKKQLFTLPLLGASSNKLISEIKVGDRRSKLLKTLHQAYSKAPHYKVVYPLIEDIILQEEDDLAMFLNYGLKKICEYLDLKPDWKMSSSLKKDNRYSGQEKVLAICKELGASQYINVPGGKDLYDYDKFTEQGLKLSFIQPDLVSYHQMDNDFVANLSIVDVIMFNDKEQCEKLLMEYALA